MHADTQVLAEIATRFAALSLVAIGGINAILPEIHRVVVDVEGWMTSAEFADLFALAQLAPGPNAMVVALVGWKVAGVAGALVATIATCGPSSVACYIAWQWADRLRESNARGVAPSATADRDRPDSRELQYARARRGPLARRVRADAHRRGRARMAARQSGVGSARGRRRATGRSRLTPYFFFRGSSIVPRQP